MTTMTSGAAKPLFEPRKTRKNTEMAPAPSVPFRVFRGLNLRGLRFAAAGFAIAFACGAAAQPAPPLINEPMAIAPGFDAHMQVINIAPAGEGPLTTAGQRGHRHPASTYAYVAKGAVINRLGDAPEKRFETGQAWSETPGQPHYIVNASRTEPAQLVVVQIVKAGTTALTEPMPLAGGAK
jgi:quercetin dioxygenase-like cupin family protein